MPLHVTPRYPGVFQGRRGSIAAAVAAAGAILAAWAFHTGLLNVGFLLLYLPLIGTVAYIGGRVPGLVTALVSLGPGWYFIVSAQYASAIRSDQLAVMLLFGAAGVLVAECAVRLRDAEAATRALALIVESSDDAIFSKSLEGTILTWNAGAERLYGYTAAEMIGRPVSVLAPPERVDEVPAIMARLRRGERIDHYESVRVRRDGARVHVSLTISPIRDDLGRVIRAATIARDITERKRAEATLRRHKADDELINVVAANTAGETRLDRMLEGALEQLRRRVTFTGGSIALIEGDDLVVRAALGPFADAALGQRMRRGQGRVWAIAETGKPFWCNDLVREGLTPSTPIRSYVAVPLAWHRQVFGVLEIDSREVGAFQPADLELLQRVAGIVSGSIELARRYAAEAAAKAEAEAAQEAAERAAERIGRLQEMTAALSGALTPAAVAEVIVGQGVVAVGARAGSLAVLTEDRQSLELLHATGYPPEFVERWRRTPVSTRVAAWAAMERREPIFFESRDALLLAGDESSTEPLPILPDGGARAVIPITIGPAIIGIVAFLFRGPQSFSSDDRGFMQTIARQCAQALDRARLYERDHRVAGTLQRAFLPAELPRLVGVAIHGAYAPGASESDVGGDWYDAFILPDDRVAVCVGDVVGRGLSAAVVMGQLRQTIRAAALRGESPSAVLMEAGRVLNWTSGGQGMATALFGIFDPERLLFTYAVAGHPVPLVARNGKAYFVEGGGGLPLGIGDARLAPEQSVSLPPGTLTVLYTDGLTELTRDPTQGELTLAAAAEAEQAEPSGDAAQGILGRVLQDRPASDDIALVTLSVAPTLAAEVAVALPAEPRTGRAVRQAFRRLAGTLGVDPDVAALFEVALGEAVNNAVEHAYRAVKGNVYIRIWREGTQLVAEVEDRGQWRSERREGRGYGLRIIHALMESAEVRRTSSGTIVRLAASLAGNPTQTVVAASGHMDVMSEGRSS